MRALLLVASFLFLGLQSSWSYSFKELRDDFVDDTREVFLKGAKTGVYYDFLEKKFPDRYKFGLSSPLAAYKFLSVEPIAIFTPSSSEAIAEVGFAFPIRLGRLPIGYGKSLSDLMPERKTDGSLMDKLSVGFYGSQNLISGKFGFGLGATLSW